MKPTLTVKPIFVKTANVRNFEAMMSGLDLSAGEGRFGLVWGRAGRGKSRTAEYYCANNKNCLYVLMHKVWRTSPSEFFFKLATELGLTSPPRRVGPLYNEICARLEKNRPTVFIDEPDKVPSAYLEIIRDMTQATGAPFVLIGEEALPGMMRKERRVWSRTFGQVEFKPFGVADIVQYMTAAAGIRFAGQEAVDAIYQKSEGDIRIVKVIFFNLVQVLNAKGIAEADRETVEAAIRQAFAGAQ